MRLCWNDGLNGPLGKADPKELKFYYDIGFRVIGINSGDVDATTADVGHAKRIIEDCGLMPGPYGAGACLLRPDPAENEMHKRRIRNALKIAGNLGCTGIRVSVGSMHPENVWMHHPANFTQRAMDELVRNTRELVPIAEEAGCMICPETTQWTIVRSIATMKEFVDRVDSPYVKIVFDFVNHINPERAYDTKRFIKTAVARLGDRIGEFHVKDFIVQNQNLVIHIDEAPMGTGLLDHETLIRVSGELEPWKTFSLEHIQDRNLLKPAYDYIQGVAGRIGHRWTDPRITRTMYEAQRRR